MDISKLANPLPRLASYIIDGLIIGVFSFLVLIPFSFLLGSSYWILKFFSFLISFIISLVYYIIFLTKDGTTPGYKYLGLRIVKENGNLLNTGEVALRTFLNNFIPFLALINGIMILVTQKRQGLHDMAVSSICEKIEDKDTRAKWVVGTYITCSCLMIILSIVLITVGGIAVADQMSKSTQLQKSDEITTEVMEEKEMEELRKEIEKEFENMNIEMPEVDREMSGETTQN